MLAPLLFVLGVAAVYCYDVNDGRLLFSDAIHYRSARSIRQGMSNSGVATRMAMFHRMNNVHARHWRPTVFNGNNRMQNMHNRPYWIPPVYAFPYNIPYMHAFTRASPHVRPFQPVNMPIGRVPLYMFPRSTNQRFPNMNVRWQPPHISQYPMMHWNLQRMNRFPMMARQAFAQGSTGRGGVKSSTEASAGKGSKGVTPFDDRK